MNVHELEGVRLDAAVAKAEGRVFDMVNVGKHGIDFITVVDPEQRGWVAWSPSRVWADGGPIIERERIAIYFADESPRTTEPWVAGFCLEIDQGRDWGGDTGSDSASLSLDYSQTGPTPLIAAMRAYVAMMASTRKLEGVD